MLFAFVQDLKECEDSAEVEPACDPPNIQPAETECDVNKIQTCTRKRQVCARKLSLKLSCVCLV